MGLQDYLNLTKETLGIKTVKKTEENGYTLVHEARTFRLYQYNKQIVFEGSIGTPLKDTHDTNRMLAELLQFNLKRTQFLDNTIFLEKNTQQLCLREIFSEQDFSPEQLKNHLEDFVLNLEVIEDRFFKKQN